MGVISATEPSLDFWARSPPAEMWISRVSHLTYLRCDEAGTEVAAATSIVEEDGIALEPPKELIADRPFWFVLYDQTQGTVLYSGFVENVEEAGDSVFKDD
jgi:serpin B